MNYSPSLLLLHPDLYAVLSRAPIDSGYPDLAVVAERGVVTADGLAVDWVYNHVYWTDTGQLLYCTALYCTTVLTQGSCCTEEIL